MFRIMRDNRVIKGAISFCPYSKGVWVVDTATLETYSLEELEVVL